VKAYAYGISASKSTTRKTYNVAKSNSLQITIGTELLLLETEDEIIEIARLLNEVAEKQAAYDIEMKTVNRELGTMYKSIDELIGYQFKAATSQASFTDSSISDLRTQANETTTRLSELSLTIQE